MVFNALHLTANGATTIAHPCTLHAVTINSKGATANTLTLADGANTIAIIDTTASIGTLRFDVQCDTSLVATLATGTAADVTVIYG